MTRDAGPFNNHCSCIYDPDATLEYAYRLLSLQVEIRHQLVFVMRTYFEKPRTTTGRKGLVSDKS